MDKSRASDGTRGLLLVPNIADPKETFEIIDVVGNVMKVKGDMTYSGNNFLGNTWGVIYGQSIKSFMLDAHGNGFRDIKFFKPQPVIDSYGGYVDYTPSVTTPVGLCQVCHSDTSYWRSDGSIGNGNHNGANAPCMTCHDVYNGFDHGDAGNGDNCADCHNSNQHGTHVGAGGNCANCHDLANMRDGNGDIIDPRTSGRCEACHHDGRGGLPNHNDYKENWTNGSYNLSCDGCHNGRPGMDALVMSNDGHDRLVGEAGIRQYPCYYCHDESVDSSSNLLAKHANGARDVAVDEHWVIVDQDPPAVPTYDQPSQVCSNIYCHTDGTIVDPDMRPYPWSGGPKPCNSCHGHNPVENDCADCHTGTVGWAPEQLWMSAMPMYANTGPGTSRANSHFRHIFTGFSCDDCHVDTVVGSCLDCHDSGVPSGHMDDTNHVNGAYHVDKRKSVKFKGGGTYDSATKTCSSTACHELGTPPVWGGSVDGNVTCANCHTTVGPDEDDFGGFNGNPARINYQEWIINGHGRPAASGNYPGSSNPAADFPANGCWYCHDNKVLHQVEENPFRLRKHDHFNQRFTKECVYCHMSEEPSLPGQLDEIQCMDCHNSTFTLAPQLGAIGVDGTILPDYNNTSRPDHGVAPIINGVQRCDSTDCHVNDARRHQTDSDQIWTTAEKADVQNQYVMMGVCLKCHDDDSGGECQTCHQGAQYTTGFDPQMGGLGFKQPQKAKASSFHFGYKHYLAYEKSVQADPNSPVWKGGKFCWDCHDPHGDRNYIGDFNIYMVQNKVATETDGVYGKPIPAKRRDVVFTRKVNGRDYARKDPPYDGICNVCHDDDPGNDDRARHYNRSSGDTHNASRTCTTCHEHRFTDSHAGEETCNTCHQNKPVPRHTAFGQTRDCTKCHDGVLNGRLNIMKQLTESQSHHIQRADGTITNKDCYTCHWEATELGLINLTYHEGYSYKDHDGTPGAAVDLVIWNKEDTPGSGVDADPARGSRPEVYDLDGTSPDGPGVPTAVTFLASDMNSDDLDPAVKLQKERVQVENLTPHCLGCHSDQNNDTEVFGDCKTPRQYAWDGQSVDARYSQTETATWGKYSGYPNAAAKNLQKAFSAHGKAVSNGGGFDPATGVNGTGVNTRANDQSLDGQGHNVQCYDCHSSHGSFVEGITSSYVSFDGEKHGANLKETQAGYGGYVNNYKATAYPDPTSVNFYNAGAGQCFDCHETQNSGDATSGSNRTPWGYKSTYGAAEPIVGYKDNPRFVGSYPGITESPPLPGRPVAESTVDLSYRQGRVTMGGHMNASHNLAPSDARRTDGFTDTAMNTTVYGSIDGLCTPCHDPHGVSPVLGANQQYAVPLLKGTWLTSPFKEDTTVPDPYGNSVTTHANGDPQSWGKGYTHPSPYQPEDARWNIDRTTFGTERIAEDDSRFAGLCLNCHPRSNKDGSPNLEDGLAKNTEFRSSDRIHESVKGWGANTEHSYPCSKCHQPHSSGLPRLLQTNCLDFKHRGGRLFGGLPWLADLEHPSANGHGEHRGYPIADTLGNLPSYEAAGACHVQAPLNPGVDWKDKQLWNNVTPW
ncbi:MAG: CxxxxCH/CxxCH domain-containing protein [Proteobacteria bacterium]|nr:CxxxxCH/CxxCH domain-containing protein [Pseudomonadota bacterium]MBU1737211.1 CxxxxCH/CxxCH domain-containing protein [Pseudomonadota bacterium]